MKIKLWTLTWIADWEGGTTVYTTEAELLKAVREAAEESTEYSGIDLPVNTATLDELVEFVIENGWKVQHFLVETHEVKLPGNGELK